MNQLFFGEKLTTEIEIEYENFITKPNNLTEAECKTLTDMVLKHFLYGPEDGEYSEKICEVQSKNGGEPIWIIDFLVYITVFLIASILFTFWFLKPAQEKLDEVFDESERHDSKCFLEESEHQEADETEDKQDNTEVQGRTDEDEIGSNGEEHEEFLLNEAVNSSPFNITGLESEDSLEETPMPPDLNESFNEPIDENLDQGISVNTSVSSSGYSPRFKKPMPNFIQKNIENVLQKSESLHACSSRMSLTPGTPTKTRRSSLIPVRADTKFQQHEQNESTC